MPQSNTIFDNMSPGKALLVAAFTPSFVSLGAIVAFMGAEYFTLSALLLGVGSIKEQLVTALAMALLLPNVFFAVFYNVPWGISLLIGKVPGGETANDYNEKVMKGYKQFWLFVNVCNLLIIGFFYVIAVTAGEISSFEKAGVLAGSALAGFLATFLGDKPRLFRIVGYSTATIVLATMLLSVFAPPLFTALLEMWGTLTAIDPRRIEDPTKALLVFVGIVLTIVSFVMIFNTKHKLEGLLLLFTASVIFFLRTEILEFIGGEFTFLKLIAFLFIGGLTLQLLHKRLN